MSKLKSVTLIDPEQVQRIFQDNKWLKSISGTADNGSEILVNANTFNATIFVSSLLLNISGDLFSVPLDEYKCKIHVRVAVVDRVGILLYINEMPTMLIAYGDLFVNFLLNETSDFTNLRTVLFIGPREEPAADLGNFYPNLKRLSNGKSSFKELLSNLSPISKLSSLTTLNLTYCYILTDLRPLSKLIKLNSLEFTYCKSLINLKPISCLNELISLNFERCKSIVDLNPLSPLTKLKSLGLTWCVSLTDLSPLSSLTGLTSLDLEGCSSLTDLSPLSNLTELTSLNLRACKSLTDLSPLSSLTGLTSLDLEGYSSLTDLSPLSNLTGLTSLNLRNCKSLTDLRPLSNLTVLTSLSLSMNEFLTDLGPISSLTELTSLDLRACKSLIDLSPLSQLVNLRSLDLVYCRSITTIFPISGLYQLTNLKLMQCESLLDIRALRKLTGILHLSLFGCKSITDLSALSHLTELMSLDLRSCKLISDLSPLSGLVGLKKLNLGLCDQIADLSPLSGLVELSNLYLHGCDRITDLSPLSSLVELTSLNLSRCDSLKDLSPISGLISLTYINLVGCNLLTDLSPLSKLNNITDLDLSNCQLLTDIRPLAGLRKIESLYLSGCNSLTDLGPLSTLPGLKDLNLRGCLSLTDISFLRYLDNLSDLDVTDCFKLTQIKLIAHLPGLKKLFLRGCPNIRDIHKLISLRQLEQLEWIDPLACSAILMQCATNRQDVAFIKENLPAWIKGIELSKEPIYYAETLLSAINCLAPNVPIQFLSDACAAMRSRGLQQEKGNELNAEVWEYWLVLVLQQSAKDAMQCFKMVVENLNITRETETLLGPVVVALATYAQKYREEKEPTITWVAELLALTNDHKAEQRLVAPSAAVFYASLGWHEDVRIWLDKATDERTPLWRDKVLLALVNYYAGKLNFRESQLLLKQVQITEMKDKAIAALALAIAELHPVDAAFLLDDINDMDISVTAARSLLQQPALLHHPQGIYQLLLHLQVNETEMAACLEVLIEKDKDGRVADALKQLFLPVEKKAISSAILLELCNNPELLNYVKPRALEKYKMQLAAQMQQERAPAIVQLLQELQQQNMIDKEEAEELKYKIV